ncbi:unnamed protein product [Allacma fusca]|uniref:Ubiquitin-like domain-containing protein n=1 Tax=Allacma fusca TaxID=39272 RepID=A0A8J2KVD8_9HEXA|nr:unnamed protein product [Allacma fusca]
MPSLLEAIRAKYEDDQIHCLEAPIGIFVPKVGPRKSIPRLLILNDCDVDSAGDEESLEKTCAGVLEIDLAHNRLTEWIEISKILQYSPSVTFLNLGFNNLSAPLKLTCQEKVFRFPPLPRLTVLILIGTNIPWESVWFLLQQASSLQELHLSINNFDKVNLKGGSSGGTVNTNNVTINRSTSNSSDSGNESCSDDDNGFSFPHIRKVMFDGNPIRTWAEVSKLGTCFPSLRHIGLADCPIDSIPEDAHQNFENLQSVSMTNTLIHELTDLSHLNCFPSLTELRIQGIPLLSEMTAHERRQFLVAMLPSIKKLNGGAPISLEEREDSERAFIRRFAQNQKDISPPERYYDLISIHGELAPLVEVQLKPTTRVKVNLIFGEMVTQRQISVYQTTSELKTHLESLVGLRPSNMRLIYTSEGSFGGEVMRFPDKKLYSYNMRDGDEIRIELKKSAKSLPLDEMIRNEAICIAAGKGTLNENAL